MSNQGKKEAAPSTSPTAAADSLPPTALPPADELTRLRVVVAELEQDNARLRASLQKTFDELRQLQPGEIEEKGPAKAGHRWVITVYPFQPESGELAAPGTVLQVPEADFAHDRLRRYPALKDLGRHREEQHAKAEQKREPLAGVQSQLQEMLAISNQRATLRQEQRRALVAEMLNPNNVAALVPEV